MYTVTWRPGTNQYLDSLFDHLREIQYNDTSHRLWENYSKESFSYAGIIAYTICFNGDDTPEMCSSISQRDCWPLGAYRILNRTWKHSNKKQMMKEISLAMGETTLSQISIQNCPAGEKQKEMITLTDINKTYYTEATSLHVLKGIDLHIAKGEYVSIMGGIS